VSLNFDNSSGRLGAEAFGSATAERTDTKIGWIRDAAGDRWPDIELEVGAYLTVVDDNPEVLKLMRLLLSDEYDLDFASSGEAAVSSLVRTPATSRWKPRRAAGCR